MEKQQAKALMKTIRQIERKMKTAKAALLRLEMLCQDSSDPALKQTITQLQNDMDGAILNFLHEQTQLRQKINDLADPRCRQVMSMRYLQGLPWKDIERESNYSRGHLMRLHNLGLDLLQ